jgi:hypothetical protein
MIPSFTQKLNIPYLEICLERKKGKDSLVEILGIVSQFIYMLYGCLLMISHAMLYGRLIQLFGVENSLVDYRFDFFYFLFFSLRFHLYECYKL